MTDRKKCEELHDKIVTAFGEQSGGEYNDTMYYQALGAKEEMDEAEADDDWVYALKNLTECWKYVKHLAKIDEMQNNIPSEIYS
jgi:hypothetical protein|tara:strand:+ start:36 stop:287 length:252 start_codon:yes stop_codon:yes gene_type:complete